MKPLNPDFVKRHTQIVKALAAADYTVRPGTVKGRALPLIVRKAAR